MPPIHKLSQLLSPRADSFHKPSAWIPMIFAGIILVWVFINTFICRCFFHTFACERSGWIAMFAACRKCCCACYPTPQQMAREVDLAAEDRIRAEARERWRRADMSGGRSETRGFEEGSMRLERAEDRRRERMVYARTSGEAGVSEVQAEEAMEEELPRYRARDVSDNNDQQRRNDEILRQRREEELAASDEREISLDCRRETNNELEIREPPPAYVVSVSKD